jgi:hypothetical protein
MTTETAAAGVISPTTVARFTVDDYSAVLSPKQLANIVKHVAAIASTDQARGVLAGVLVESDPNGIKLTATDSYRLIHVTVPMADVPAFDPIIVHAKTAGKLPAFVKGSRRLMFMYSAGDESAMFTRGDGGTLPLPVLSGTFADYRRLIPAEDTYGWPSAGETVSYNPMLLSGLLDSMGGIVGNRGRDPIGVRFVNASAMKLTVIRGASVDGVDVTGLIMPLRR